MSPGERKEPAAGNKNAKRATNAFPPRSWREEIVDTLKWSALFVVAMLICLTIGFLRKQVWLLLGTDNKAKSTFATMFEHAVSTLWGQSTSNGEL